MRWVARHVSHRDFAAKRRCQDDWMLNAKRGANGRLVAGYSKANASPILKLFLVRLDKLIVPV